jgi:imidazoleglycerol-phosphate dehydratase
MSGREAQVSRKTAETQIDVTIGLDGAGDADVTTGIPFFEHMLSAFAKHGLFDMTIKAAGDLEVDPHHTVEDVGIVLGQALRKALGDKGGIARFGDALMPMDEALALVALDLSGRPHLEYAVELPGELIGTFDVGLARDFLHALVNHAAMTLHVRMLSGTNAHHMLEAVFKGLGRALCEATRVDERVGVPSTKGALDE